MRWSGFEDSTWRAPSPIHLERDYVAGGGADRAHFRQLAERMGPRLEGIELCENKMDSSALLAPCRHGLFRGVAFVANQRESLSDEAIRALAECPEACNLTALRLDHSGLTDAGLLMIAGSPHLRNVRDLFVGRIN